MSFYPCVFVVQLKCTSHLAQWDKELLFVGKVCCIPHCCHFLIASSSPPKTRINVFTAEQSQRRLTIINSASSRFLFSTLHCWQRWFSLSVVTCSGGFQRKLPSSTVLPLKEPLSLPADNCFWCLYSILPSINKQEGPFEGASLYFVNDCLLICSGGNPYFWRHLQQNAFTFVWASFFLKLKSD